MSDFIEIAKNVITEPSVSGAAILFWSSLVNEIFSVFPFVVVISGQFAFLNDPFSLASIIKFSTFVFVPFALGAGLGSLPLYALTYFGGKPAIEKFGRYFRLSWDQVERVRSRFGGSWYDELIFLVLRSIPFTPSLPVSIAAGVMRMNIAPYLVLTVAGAIIRIALMFVFIALGAEGLNELAH